jgi:hypothetical protein
VDSEVDLIRHSQDLRAMWQGRVLAAAEGRMMVAVASMLAHSYDLAMPILLRVVQPKCWDGMKQSLRTPFLCSCGKVAKNGTIVADVIVAEDQPPVSKVLFSDTRDFEYELRKLADRLKLSDAERVEFFKVAKNWVVADTRLDPTMDPRDPDAKRLTVH